MTYASPLGGLFGIAAGCSPATLAAVQTKTWHFDVQRANLERKEQSSMGRVGTVQDRRWACVGWNHVSEGVQMAAVVWEREDGWLGWCKPRGLGFIHGTIVCTFSRGDLGNGWQSNMAWAIGTRWKGEQMG